MSATPRRLAVETLAKWVDLAHPPLMPQRDDPRWAGRSTRERNAAFDMIAGVLRWRLLLDALIDSRLTRSKDKLQPPVRALLWLGLYQLLFHESAPSYAIVSTTVELAKQLRQGRAAGLVNAILRGVTRLKPMLEIRHGFSASTFPRDFSHHIRLGEPIFPNPRQNMMQYLSVVTSHPQPLVERLVQVHGEAVATDILIRNNLRPAILLRADDPGLSPSPDTLLKPHEIPGYFVAAGGWNDKIEKEIAQGNLSPQDPTSGKPIPALTKALAANAPAETPWRVLDLCAGLGTKTMQLARALPHAIITATDMDTVKLQRLRQRAVQMNTSHVVVKELPQVVELVDGHITPMDPHPFHAVLVDAPCSNTGVMARRPQSRWRWPILDITALRQIQLGLLTQAAALAANAGHALIVYSTCSIDPAENQEVVNQFLKTGATAFSLSEEQTTLPCPSDNPQEQYDGGYYAILTSRRPS